MEKLAMLAITLLTLITYTGLIPLTSAQMEEVKLTLDLEPIGCGRVYAEPLGEDYIYRAGTTVQIYAEQAEGCKFAYWVSDLAGLNGSLNNPVTVTLFSDSYFKAVFVRIGEAKPDGEVVKEKTHAFLRVTANVSRFQEDVRLVPIGEEVMVTAPRDIYLNDTARYVFVGWEGYESKEPTLKVLVTGDMSVKALYTLYMRFMELWYHYSDFTIFHAPIVELGPGERLKPLHLLLKPMNITLPVGSKIPIEFADRVEVEYQKEHLLVVRCLAPEVIPVMINGEYYSLGSSVERWIPEGLKADVIVLVEETERGWITEPRQLSFIMDGPKSVMVGYEEKPHSWAADSPLKPIIYPLLEYVVDSFKDTGMWPQISQMISQPTIVYSILLAFPSGLGVIGYLGYRLLSRIELGGSKAGKARRIIEEKIKKASPEDIISVIPSGSTSSTSREEIKLPEHAPFPEWLNIEVPEHVEEYRPMKTVEKIEEVEVVREVGEVEEKVRGVEVLEEMLGEVRADELAEALMTRLDGEVFEKLKDSIASGRLKVEAMKGAVWSPLNVRAISKALDEKRAVAVVGVDQYVRRRVAEWVGFIESEVTGKPHIFIEDAYERDVESAVARIGNAYIVILGENVKPDVVKTYLYATKILGRRLIKLGGGPLPLVKLSTSRRELAAYMVAKAISMGLVDRLSLEDVFKVSDIALRTRAYMTVDRYLQELSDGPVDMENFKKTEFDKLFDDLEKLALAEWKKTGDINNAVIHYSNILAQLDPANMDSKLRIFKEKLLKLSRGLEDGEGSVELKSERVVDSELKARVAEKMTKAIENIKNEEARRRLEKYLGKSRRRES